MQINTTEFVVCLNCDSKFSEEFSLYADLEFCSVKCYSQYQE